ncbi:MAG: nuclear transport factor 2 family protein [bacterium]|nr:nuclear transport factor 2 family protein [bacterium]MCP5032007.1 nuclear transport factor 2 family protein [Actinomycetes bacterium]
MQDHTDTADADVASIREHVELLFEAYLTEDRDALLRGRLPEWKGFQLRSTHLIRGVEDYARELDKALGAIKVQRYEFLDFEVEVLGDVALVYYIARDWLDVSNPKGDVSTPTTALIRALDVYRRVDGDWIQAGSNISAIPDDSDG